jgi:hypothetical protein
VSQNENFIDKPNRLFRVIKFWMDETSGIALALRTGLPSYQLEDEEGSIHLLLHLQSMKRMKTAGASGGPIRQALTPGLFLTARWLRDRKGPTLSPSSQLYAQT